MAQKTDPIKQLVMDALDGGYALSGEKIQQLREKSTREITTLKTVFWVALGLFNLMVWDPFNVPLSASLRWGVAFGALVVAIVFPIIGIRRHRARLFQLEDSTQGPKRRKANDAGRQYIDRVKKQGRYFIRAEFELLEGD